MPRPDEPPSLYVSSTIANPPVCEAGVLGNAILERDTIVLIEKRAAILFRPAARSAIVNSQTIGLNNEVGLLFDVIRIEIEVFLRDLVVISAGQHAGKTFVDFLPQFIVALAEASSHAVTENGVVRFN